MISLLRSSSRALSRSARSLTSSASLPASAPTTTPSSTPATRSSVPPSVAAIPYDPAQIPTTARQQQLVDLRNAIFGTNERAAAATDAPPPRDGSKILKQRLHGPALVRWYGDRYTSWKAWNQKFPGLDLVDLQEQQRSVSLAVSLWAFSLVPDILFLCRLADLEARRKRGKVTPKKGQFSLASQIFPTAARRPRLAQAIRRYDQN